MKRKWVATFTGAALAGALTVGASSAYANYRSISIFVCHYAGGSGAIVANEGQLSVPSSFQPASLICPIESDARLDFKTATVTVSGWANAGGNWQAKVCSAAYDGGGGACGLPAVAFGPGGVQASLPLDEWTAAGINDFPYVTVQMGPPVNGVSDVVWGITLQE